MRYLIAFSLADSLTVSLTAIYETVFTIPLPIKWLHITLVSPFTLVHETDSPDPHIPVTHALQQMSSSFTQPTYRFGPPAMFTQKQKQILHLPVIPKEPLIALHDQLVINLADHVSYDFTPFDYPFLPAYLPHLSLAYNTPELTPEQTLSLTTLTAPLTFTLSLPVLYQETAPTIWDPV